MSRRINPGVMSRVKREFAKNEGQDGASCEPKSGVELASGTVARVKMARCVTG